MKKQMNHFLFAVWWHIEMKKQRRSKGDWREGIILIAFSNAALGWSTLNAAA
jgi:hypothetical protein